jgi:hypothetical protein
LASTSIIGIAADPLHVLIREAAKLDLGRTKCAIEPVWQMLLDGRILSENQFAGFIYVKDQLASRMQVQRIAYVLGDCDLAFAGERGLQGAYPPGITSFSIVIPKRETHAFFKKKRSPGR